MIFINNAGLELKIISKVGKKCIVQFTDTGSIRNANIDNIKAGKVKDLHSPSRYGVGYDGEFVKVSYWKKARDLWSNMLKRCYYEGDAKGYYGSVVVDARWHCFANFLEDLPKLEGFNDWLNNKGMQLDKDKSGTKVYSVLTCIFLTEFENKSIQPNYRKGKIFCKETRQWLTPTV